VPRAGKSHCTNTQQTGGNSLTFHSTLSHASNLLSSDYNEQQRLPKARGGGAETSAGEASLIDSGRGRGRRRVYGANPHF